jgi:hypothetical protein
MRFSGRIMRIWQETLAQTITSAQQMRIMGFFQLLNLKFPSNF